jgi:putative addiction module component (TIGR02574 family)
MKRLGIDRMNAEERLLLLEEIWDSLSQEGGDVGLTDGQLDELERRMIEDDASPNEVLSWDEVKRKYSPTGGK